MNLMSQASSHLIGLQALPPQSTPFVGREQEVAEITDLLGSPECRLLTLVGPGGIGKSRLSLRVAEEMADAFADGVYFVTLQPLQSTDFFVPAMADALLLQFSGQTEPVEQLLNFLEQKHLLLVLDNMEHLLDGAGLLSDICLSSPGVKCMVTSREVLSLAEEWLYPVQGLELPERLEGSAAQETEAGIETYDAIRLFIERARRVRRDFDLENELEGIVRICQLVEGMPLALELAASWTKSLRCDAIADEIKQNLYFLASTVRNVPERHRSMIATLDYSWQRFNPEEQEVFKRLSVFRGGFRRRAAEKVAGATLSILTALVDKSLLRWHANGRYEMHELLRQYGAGKLTASGDAVGETYERHRVTYIDFLEQRAESIISVQQSAVLQEIADELDNIRMAWQRTIDQLNVADVRRSIYTYYEYSDFRGRYREVADAFEEALVQLAQAGPSAELELTRALLQTCLGWHYIRLGQLERARANFTHSQSIYGTLGQESPPGFGTDNRLGLALLAQLAGDFASAATVAEEARRQHEVSGDLLNLQIAFFMLANAAIGQGEYDSAHSYGQEAYRVAQQTNNPWFIAYILGDLGSVARARGDVVQARRYYEASYSLKKQVGDPEGMALALNQLGKIAEREDNVAEAERLYKQSLAVYRRINDRGGLAASLHGLGTVALASRQFESARNHIQNALEIALDVRFLPLILSILVDAGDLMASVGEAMRGIELLSLVLHHDAGDRETKDRAQVLLERMVFEQADDSLSEIMARGRDADLAQVGLMVLTELAMLRIPAETLVHTGKGQALPGDQPLIEPLTPRELEVLGLMASGLGNRDIAEELIIAVGTVKSYTNQIYGKLGVQNRVQAVTRAQELALI